MKDGYKQLEEFKAGKRKYLKYAWREKAISFSFLPKFAHVRVQKTESYSLQFLKWNFRLVYMKNEK
jgi:hypothetical protein